MNHYYAHTEKGSHPSVVCEDDPSADDEPVEPEEHPAAVRTQSAFYDIVQHPEPKALVDRLHQLIDGCKGADVGCVLLKAFLDGHLSRRPTQMEFKSEFALMGAWTAVHNYMNDNSEKALDRANKITIF